jgi:uncharacterized membrane protein YdjX (TVP38/TMEM64 family)
MDVFWTHISGPQAHPAMVLLPYAVLPENRRLGFGFLFMAIPGLSDALKNFLLPLSGIRFFPYMVCAWLIQSIMGIPFVIMGRAVVQWDMKLLAVAGSILLAIFLFRRKILGIYRHIMKL